MKLQKLLTLSQFIELNRSRMEHNTGIFKSDDINGKNVDSWNSETIWAFGRIEKYNNFLKQSLIKEMFVNQTDDPKNKLIFRCVKKRMYSGLEKIILPLNIGSMCVGNLFDDGIFYTLYSTIHDLAEATKGELDINDLNL